jgi:hypothetical protein
VLTSEGQTCSLGTAFTNRNERWFENDTICLRHSSNECDNYSSDESIVKRPLARLEAFFSRLLNQGVRHSSPLPIKTEIVGARSGSEAFFVLIHLK